MGPPVLHMAVVNAGGLVAPGAFIGVDAAGRGFLWCLVFDAGPLGLPSVSLEALPFAGPLPRLWTVGRFGPRPVALATSLRESEKEGSRLAAAVRSRGGVGLCFIAGGGGGSEAPDLTSSSHAAALASASVVDLDQCLLVASQQSSSFL